MKITTARLISQIFFFILFLWFCIVMNLGGEWWQLKGWSVNLFLQLDPLVGLATLITSRTIYAELLWGSTDHCYDNSARKILLRMGMSVWSNSSFCRIFTEHFSYNKS